MDETESPQTPPELLIILAALQRADEGVPLQTISAPKFTGRFNKGVDYVGDLRRPIGKEFSERPRGHCLRRRGNVKACRRRSS